MTREFFHIRGHSCHQTERVNALKEEEIPNTLNKTTCAVLLKVRPPERGWQYTVAPPSECKQRALTLSPRKQAVFCLNFYCSILCLRQVLAVGWCLSVRPSQSYIVSK